MTDARASLGDSYLRSILEATCFSDGNEEKPLRGNPNQNARNEINPSYKPLNLEQNYE